MTYSLRPATDRDIDWLDPFYERIMRPFVELTHEWNPTIFREKYRPSNCQIIQVNGQDVGLFKQEILDGHLFLWDIQLENPFRGRGIGSDLVTRLQAEARSQNLPIKLRVLKGNPAIDFYRKFGFEISAELDHCHEMSWNETLTIRRARAGDADLFREIRLRALQDSPEAFGSTYESAISRDLDSWTTQLNTTTSGPDRNTQFAFSRDTCIGLAALYREPGAPSGDLIMMWVEPEFRGSPAATRLVEELLLWARISGLEKVGLGVSNNNSRARAFYSKKGFVPTGEDVDVDAERALRGIRMETDLG